MIGGFFGEALHHPAPLELSLNPCTYKCQYCFVPLRGERKSASVQRVMNLLRDFRKRDTLEARLLAAGYPVCMSNRSDPFAESNRRVSRPIMEAMTALGIPLYIQTKGGLGAAETAKVIKPCVWYITASIMDDELRRRIEPNAPTFAERMQLVEQVTALGHSVVIGINPAVPEWLPEPEKLIDAAAQAGAKAFFVRSLHFSRSTVFPKAMLAAIGEPVARRAQQKVMPPQEKAYFDRIEAALIERGARYDIECGLRPSGYSEVDKAVYGKKRFPSLVEFLEFCHKEYPARKVFNFDDFWGVVGQYFPEGQYRLEHYIGATAHQVLKDRALPKLMTYRDLMKVYWTEYRLNKCPVKCKQLSWVATDDSDVTKQVTAFVGNDGLPVVAFNPAGYKTTFVKESEI